MEAEEADGQGTAQAQRQPEPPGDKPTITLYSKVFEDKIAQDSKNQYNGTSDEAPAWRIFTRNYLFGVMHEIDELFDWAEQRQHDPITAEEFAKECEGKMMDCDPKVLNHHLWRYLNLNLTGDAKMILQNATRANGLELWRTLMIDIV